MYNYCRCYTNKHPESSAFGTINHGSVPRSHYQNTSRDNYRPKLGPQRKYKDTAAID